MKLPLNADMCPKYNMETACLHARMLCRHHLRILCVHNSIDVKIVETVAGGAGALR